MTQDFIDMIYLFACGIHGIAPQKMPSPNAPEIKRLSLSQGVWPIVFDPLKKVSDDAEIPDWNKKIVFSVMENVKRCYHIHEILKLFTQSGINFALLKGETVARFYANPDMRISGDVDIFVPGDEETRAGELLRQKGFFQDRDTKHSNHSVFQSTQCGVIELHRYLYKEIAEQGWFDNKVNVEEDYIEIPLSDGSKVMSLGITDGLIFVSMHMIKHFLTEGMGVRQIADTLLYMKHYKNEINWERYFSILQYLKYDKFIQNIMGIGVAYLKFDRNDFPPFEFTPQIAESILSDCETGGVFGHDEKDRKTFDKLYTKARYNCMNRTEEFEDYLKSNKKGWILQAIFPRKSVFYRRYAYTRKHPILLPVAWLHRIWDFGISLIKKQKKVDKYVNPSFQHEDNETINERMKLLEKLEMI